MPDGSTHASDLEPLLPDGTPIAALLPRLRELAPEELLRWASEQFGSGLTFATGLGVEGCVLIDMIARAQLPIDLFILDTGVLFPETYALLQRLERRYGVTIRRILPSLTLDQQAELHGPALWERDPDRCCQLRKVEPLRQALVGRTAWLSGIRRGQTRERSSVEPLAWDRRFGLFKLSPLHRFSERDIWQAVFAHDVPYNPLHDEGFPSIGCAPCTTAVAEGEDPRAGRWRGQAKKECGLHVALPVLHGAGPSEPHATESER